VFIGPEGEVLRFRHTLPEARPGPSLSEEQARSLVIPVIEELYGLDPNQLDEISAVPTKHPNRDDWRFTFADRHNYPLEEGEARITVTVAGDQIADANRWVHVPEEWRRQERDKASLIRIVHVLVGLAVTALLLSGAVGAIVAWSRRRFDVRKFLGVFALLSGLGVLELVNSWPEVRSNFTTAEPWALQTLVFIGVGIVLILVTAAVPALILGFLDPWRRQGPSLEGRDCILLGLAVGAVAAGATAVADAFAPSLSPAWPDYTPAGTYLPVLNAALSPFALFVQTTAAFLLFFAAVDRLSDGWKRRRILLFLVVLVFGLALMGTRPIESLATWAVAGLAVGLALLAGYLFLVRYQLGLVPAAVGMAVALEVIRGGLCQAHSAALPGAVVAAVLITSASVYWSTRLQPQRGADGYTRSEGESELPAG
jgi:hypothetical protein